MVSDMEAQSATYTDKLRCISCGAYVMIGAGSVKLPCPECGVPLELTAKPGNPYRLIASHNCGGKGLRQVYETDAPAWPPPELSDRLEPGEPPAPPAYNKYKKSFRGENK